MTTLPQDIFPWQTTQWQQLWQAKQQGRLSHALLFMGLAGIGKARFARAFAHALLCMQPSANGVGCGECHSCHLLKAKSHPDLMMIEPEETSKIISVDQIRAIVKNVHETTLTGGLRVIIINPATAMNINAANALLKTLEEPPPKTLLILISPQGLRMPATILSRCQKNIFFKPEHGVALTWLKQHITDAKIDPELLLKLAHGAPLQALAWMEQDLWNVRQDLYQDVQALVTGVTDPLQLATKWQTADQLFVVDLLLSWLTDLLRYKLTEDTTQLVNVDYKAIMMKTSVALLKTNLLASLEQLQQTRGTLLNGINLNKQLMLEDLFIQWAQYVPG